MKTSKKRPHTETQVEAEIERKYKSNQKYCLFPNPDAEPGTVYAHHIFEDDDRYVFVIFNGEHYVYLTLQDYLTTHSGMHAGKRSAALRARRTRLLDSGYPETSEQVKNYDRQITEAEALEAEYKAKTSSRRLSK